MYSKQAQIVFCKCFCVTVSAIIQVNLKPVNEILLLFFSAAEGESDEEKERAEEKVDMPRDSGCYESTENLVNGREEAETEPKTEPGADEDGETDTQLEAVQEKLQDLTVEEES